MQVYSEVRRRRRRALSCFECRRRKVRCNRGQPCDRCKELGHSCVYHDTFAMWQPETAAAPNSRRNNSWRSVILSSETIAEEAPREKSVPREADVRPASPARTSPAAHPAWRPIMTAEHTEQSPRSSASQSGHKNPKVDANMFLRRSAAHDSKIVLDKTRILRWSHWMGAGQEFGPIFACYMEIVGPGQTSSVSQETRQVLAEAGEILQKCKRLARSSKVWRPSRLFGIQGYDLAPPSRETADAMAREYFTHFESVLRILHIPSFWSAYEEFWQGQEETKMEARLLILLVIAIGAGVQNCDTAPSSIPSIAQVHQWIYAAQAWLAGPLEKDRLDIGGLQLYCLTVVARQIYSIGGDLVWMSLGSLLHRAMQLGLHYDPSHFQGMSLFKAEMRRRLWYTILELLTQAALDTAMPPTISPDEYDTEPPSNINDSDLQEDTKALNPQPPSHYTDTFLQLQLICSLPSRLKIVRYLNGINSDLAYPEAMNLNTELNITHQNTRAAIQVVRADTTPFQRNMMDFVVRRFVIPLHSPFACEARTTPAFHYSLKACTEAGQALISPEPDDRFQRLLEFGGGLFREGLRSANTAVSLGLIIQTKEQEAEGTLHRTQSYRTAVKDSVKDMVALSDRRISSGETNVKSHVFLSMVLAMTEAIEMGIPCEVKVAESARNSLYHCYGILENRIGSFTTNTPTDTGFSAESLEAFLGMEMGMDSFFSDTGFT